MFQSYWKAVIGPPNAPPRLMAAKQHGAGWHGEPPLLPRSGTRPTARCRPQIGSRLPREAPKRDRSSDWWSHSLWFAGGAIWRRLRRAEIGSSTETETRHVGNVSGQSPGSF